MSETSHTIKQYQLQAVVGHGSDSVVYTAEGTTSGDIVAIKIINMPRANDSAFIRQFDVRHQQYKRVTHAHVLQYLDFWRDPEGAYFVTPLLAGNLDSLSDISEAVLLRFTEQIPPAIASMHHISMVHGNIKPTNILYDARHNFYLTDFRLPGQSKNAPLYDAPEIEYGNTLTPQADIYSLGLLYLWLLTGKRVERPSVDQIPELLTEEIATVLQRALSSDQAARYATIEQFIDDLQIALAQSAKRDGEQSSGVVLNTALDRFIKGSSGLSWRFERKQENPYKGLQPFGEADSDYFFGRETLTTTLIRRMQEDVPYGNFLMVVGPSGSGKSSVVRAGLIAALRKGAIAGSDAWFIAEMSPRNNPITELVAALMSVAHRNADDLNTVLTGQAHGLIEAVETILPDGSTLLLVIDQFEELFTLTTDPATAKHFLKLITEAVIHSDRIRIVATLRADFYDRPLMQPEFSSIVSQRTQLVLPLKVDELEATIVKPLEQVDIKIERSLVTRIIAEVKEQPGVLPMLQYTLTELFSQSAGQSLTEATYDELGGVQGALTRRTDEIYEKLSPEQKAASQQMFLRLVMPGEGVEDTRRQATKAELISLNDSVMEEVVTIFGDARLLTFDHDTQNREPTVEVAHEAIIREWRRLRLWLDESRDDLRQQRLLAAAAHEWQAAERDSSFLALGSRLDQIENWVLTGRIELTELEKAYFKASIAERDQRRANEAAQREREKALEGQARRRLQTLVVVLASSAVIAFILTGFAFNQWQAAIETRNMAHERSILTNAQLSLYRDRNSERALSLALEAYEMGNHPDQEYRVLTETAYAPGTRRLFSGHDASIYASDLLSDGTQAISASDDDTLILWDVATGEQIHRLRGHTDGLRDVSFSPDGRLIASAALDQTLRVWDRQTGELLFTVEADGALMAVAFHSDGTIIATGSQAGTVQLWNTDDGTLLRTFVADNPDTEQLEGHSNWVMDVAFSPDGRAIFSGSRDDLVLMRDLESGDILQQFQNPNDVYHMMPTADGSRILVGGFFNEVQIWDVASGELSMQLRGHTAAIYDITLTDDQSRVLTASQDTSLRLWTLETGAELQRFVGHTGYVTSANFLPDERQFVSASLDTTLRLWDVQTEQYLGRFAGHDDTIYQLNFSADGQRLLSASRDDTVRIWDVEQRELLRTLGADDPQTEEIEGHTNRVITAAFSPDGSQILSGDYNSNLFLWDAETGELLRMMPPDDPTTEQLEGHIATTDDNAILTVWHVTFAPDGRTAFSSSFDNTIIRWDLERGTVLQRYEGHTQGVLGVTVLDDGQRFLSHSWDQTIILWDTASGEILRRYEGHTNWIWSVALSPEADTFISASADQTIILWDIETGEPLRTYLGHEDSVLSVAFSLDGQWIISSGRDHLVTLWHRDTGEWLRHYYGHENWVRTVVHSPVTNQFVTGDNDGAILIWERQTLDQIVEWARQNRHIRDLTCEERELYQIMPECAVSQPNIE